MCSASALGPAWAFPALPVASVQHKMQPRLPCVRVPSALWCLGKKQMRHLSPCQVAGHSFHGTSELVTSTCLSGPPSGLWSPGRSLSPGHLQGVGRVELPDVGGGVGALCNVCRSLVCCSVLRAGSTKRLGGFPVSLSPPGRMPPMAVCPGHGIHGPVSSPVPVSLTYSSSRAEMSAIRFLTSLRTGG